MQNLCLCLNGKSAFTEINECALFLNDFMIFCFVYVFETFFNFFQGAFHDTSSVILWAQQFGLFEKISDSSSIAESTKVNYI